MSLVTCPFCALGVPRAGERFPRVLQGLPAARQSSLGASRGPEVLWVRTSSCGRPRPERSTTFYYRCSTFPEPLLCPAPGTGSLSHPMRDTCIRPRAPWDSWEEGHKPTPKSEHGRAPWDLPGQVSWSAAGPRGWERECGTQGYQRSHVLWGPLGRGLGGLRNQRNIREGGGCWDRSRQRPRVRGPQGMKAQRRQLVKAVRGAEWGRMGAEIRLEQPAWTGEASKARRRREAIQAEMNLREAGEE